MPLLPIRSRLRRRIRHQLSIISDGCARQRDRSIRRQRIRIQQHSRLRIQRFRHQQHILVLQPVIVLEKVSSVLLLRRGEPLIIPKLQQSIANGPAIGNFLQISKSQLVLLLHPGLCVRGVRVFQPAVRIGDLGSVVIVDLIDGLCLGIGEWPAIRLCPTRNCARQ